MTHTRAHTITVHWCLLEGPLCSRRWGPPGLFYRLLRKFTWGFKVYGKSSILALEILIILTGYQNAPDILLSLIV